MTKNKMQISATGSNHSSELHVLVSGTFHTNGQWHLELHTSKAKLICSRGQPWAKSGSPRACANKVLLKHYHAHSFIY